MINTLAWDVVRRQALRIGQATSRLGLTRESPLGYTGLSESQGDDGASHDHKGRHDRAAKTSASHPFRSIVTSSSVHRSSVARRRHRGIERAAHPCLRLSPQEGGCDGDTALTNLRTNPQSSNRRLSRAGSKGDDPAAPSLTAAWRYHNPAPAIG